MDDDMDVAMVDDGTSSYNMENMFDDIAAKKSHEELLSILTSGDASIEDDIHNLLDPWFQANYEGYYYFKIYCSFYDAMLLDFCYLTFSTDFASEISILSLRSSTN
jgi:hypothetical protein